MTTKTIRQRDGGNTGNSSYIGSGMDDECGGEKWVLEMMNWQKTYIWAARLRDLFFLG